MRLLHPPAHFAERLGFNSNVRVIARDSRGRVTDVWEGHNIITDVGLTMLVASLRTTAVDASRIQRLAWGNSTTAPAATQTALGNQLGFKQVTSQAAGATGVSTTTVYLEQSEAVVQIQEFGWFAGPTSATMWARVLYARNKTNLEALQVVRTDTLTRT